MLDTVPTPAAVDLIDVDAAPTGENLTLDWSNYNEWQELDVVRYEVFRSTSPILSTAGLTPYAIVPAETRRLSVTGQVPFQTYYYAVVPVDSLGGSTAQIIYAGSYPWQPEILSREITSFIGGRSNPNVKEILSREVTAAS